MTFRDQRTLCETARAVRSGESTAQEEVARALQAIEGAPGVGAFWHVDRAGALESAAELDRERAAGRIRGLLHGVPVAIKDNIDVAGMPTTAGSSFLRSLPDADAPVVERLRAAGAVIIGKLALHELAFGGTTQNEHHGACRNPWDLGRIPGGSSGGSGAAVAARQCAASLGTDTGGSVRIPAALTGVCGLRPTSGLLPEDGVRPVSRSLDTVGPLARDAADLAVVWAVLAGRPWRAPRPSGASARGRPPLEGIAIGIAERFYLESIDPAVEARVRDAAAVLAGLGAELVEIDLPHAAEAVRAATSIIRREAFLEHGERLRRQPEAFGEDVRGRLLLGEQVDAGELRAALAASAIWRAEVERAFHEVDVVLSPTTAAVAPLAEAPMLSTTHDLVRLTYGWSLAGCPAVSVPCGFAAPPGGGDELPCGLQLAAAPFGEEVLLQIAGELQAVTDWHLRRPPGAAPAA